MIKYNNANVDSFGYEMNKIAHMLSHMARKY